MAPTLKQKKCEVAKKEVLMLKEKYIEHHLS